MTDKPHIEHKIIATSPEHQQREERQDAQNGSQSAAKPYDDPDYQASRNRWLNNIKRSSFFSSIDKYIGGLALGCFSLAFGAVVNGALVTAPLIVTGFIIAGAVASAVGAYSYYQNRRVSDPISLERAEQADIARAKLNGKEFAVALSQEKETAALAPVLAEAAKPPTQAQKSDWHETMKSRANTADNAYQR